MSAYVCSICIFKQKILDAKDFQNLHLFLFSHRVLTERMWDCLKIYRNKNNFLLLTSQTCPKRTVCIREQEFLLALFSCQAMVLLSELALGSRC